MDEHVEAVQRMQDYIEAHLDEILQWLTLQIYHCILRGTHTGFLWIYSI